MSRCARQRCSFPSAIRSRERAAGSTQRCRSERESATGPLSYSKRILASLARAQTGGGIGCAAHSIVVLSRSADATLQADRSSIRERVIIEVATRGQR